MSGDIALEYRRSTLCLKSQPDTRAGDAPHAQGHKLQSVAKAVTPPGPAMAHHHRPTA